MKSAVLTSSRAWAHSVYTAAGHVTVRIQLPTLGSMRRGAASRSLFSGLKPPFLTAKRSIRIAKRCDIIAVIYFLTISPC